MYGLWFVGGILLTAIGGVLVYVLLCVPEQTQEEVLQPFAILPVPDGSPSTKALLHHYASQIAWMDEEILRCVLLVYLPEDGKAAELCQDMAREYVFYTAMTLEEAQHLLAVKAGKCGENAAFSGQGGEF